MAKKKHTYLSVEEKRSRLADIFRDSTGEYSQADKFKAMIEDTRLAMLAEEGYVQPMHGRGVRVIYTKTQTPPFLIAGIESFGESARRNNLKTTTKLIRFTALTADDHISHRTGFAVGTELYYVQ